MDPIDGLRAAMAAVDAYYKERGIFQGRFGFGQSPALVIIDMAYGWTDPAYAGGSARLDGALAAIRELLPVARSKGLPIVYTTSPYQEKPPLKTAADYSPNYRKWDPRACAIDERVRPQPGDYVIQKEHASAFAGTPLIGHLVGQRVDTLLITGCSTSACVRATATDAKSNQLRPIIIREAVQDRSEIAHEWTLFDIQARFADVVSLEEALAYLQTLTPQTASVPGLWGGTPALTMGNSSPSDRGPALPSNPGEKPQATSDRQRVVIPQGLTPLEKRLSEDLHWAAEAPEVQQHLGKIVVIRNKRVIAVGLDQPALLEQAAAQEGCPKWEFVVEIVPPLELWETPK